MTEADDRKFVELTSNIVSAYVKNHVTPIGSVAGLIIDIHSALSNTAKTTRVSTNTEKQKPAVSVKKSVTDDHMICLECGGSFKSMKRHLMTHHFQSPDGYREKWGLAADYPMVAPNYAEARSQLAREFGLGRGNRKAK
jgi:predicted transcriptional regulator